MNRNIWFFLFFLLALAGFGPAVAQAPVDPAAQALAQAPAQAAVDPKAVAPRQEGDDMVMGLATAPITIIEYASLTCPHCANFHTTSFPQIKEQYIDQGLVKFVYRDFPLDRAALWAAQLARCAGPDRYFSFLDVLFRQQGTWARGNDGAQIQDNLKRLGRLGGISDALFHECLQNKSVENAVLEQSLKGEREFKISSTPTIIINGNKHTGAVSFEEIDKVLKPLAGRS
jgi:protein-disulfide isomerase